MKVEKLFGKSGVVEQKVIFLGTNETTPRVGSGEWCWVEVAQAGIQPPAVSIFTLVEMMAAVECSPMPPYTPGNVNQIGPPGQTTPSTPAEGEKKTYGPSDWDFLM